ncbi:hypothetical protein LOAG_13349 [Loa loa]|uniref:PLAT domain-containing protein n=1 Tax=Loa loa TaxID=7209 RepID=A0A1I7VXR9_LOALO|nr:hypothetical protein LOAG_13349 [Loa loa]EFO15162.1 hypothetical protein LOAG_13349 [Loa loa]
MGATEIRTMTFQYTDIGEAASRGQQKRLILGHDDRSIYNVNVNYDLKNLPSPTQKKSKRPMGMCVCRFIFFSTYKYNDCPQICMRGWYVTQTATRVNDLTELGDKGKERKVLSGENNENFLETSG